MAAKTRAGLEGYGVRRAGSFAGRGTIVLPATPSFVNRCIWNATSGGVSDFVVASAAQYGYLPANCNNPAVVPGARYHYFAATGDGAHEEGDGVYSSGILTRTLIRNSSNAGAIVNFSSPPVVTMGGPTANDM